MLKLLKRTSYILALTCPLCVATVAHANPHVPLDSDETILIDYKPSTKVPYNKVVRAVAKRFLSFDSEALVSFGAGNRSNVARNFSDYVDRTRARIKLRGDEIELNMKLHF